ncbi:helix-turn-helix domain-containing protein [Haloferula chungangensis]|uniref:Helix-turn-helix domain-containing protein n=1 Tax=Haloferula chungangensis TaxID=1048331 RepID=A0ABW2LB94_9BACT
MRLETQRHDLKLAGFDPEVLAGLLSAARLEHYILSPGACDVEHQHWSCGDLSIDTGRYSFPCRSLGQFPRNRVSIGYMRELSEPTWVNGFFADTTTLELYPPGCELNYRAGSRGHWVAIELPEERLQAAALRHLGQELRMPQDGMVSFPVPVKLRQALDRRLTALMTAKHLTSVAVERFFAELCGLLVHLHPRDAEPLIRRAAKRRKLIECVDMKLRGRIGMDYATRNLAREVGVSERTLQRHFAEALGVTPIEWARCLALHHARQRLEMGDPNRTSVEGLAREAGFRHMGRFAGYYRELFGEFPTTTLRRLKRTSWGQL